MHECVTGHKDRRTSDRCITLTDRRRRPAYNSVAWSGVCVFDDSATAVSRRWTWKRTLWVERELDTSAAPLHVEENALGGEGTGYIADMLRDNNTITGLVSVSNVYAIAR